MRTENLTDTHKKLIAFLRANPQATIPDIMAEFAFKSRNSAYFHLRRLENRGIIQPPKVERSGWKVVKEAVEKL